MNYSEMISKRVLEAIFPGATLEYRAAQSNGEYDFDLRHSNGTTGAVEVTSAVDEALAQTVAAIRSKKKGGSVITAVDCSKSWLIFPTKSASINSIRTDADSQLAKLEQEGIERFFCGDNSPYVRDICCQLNITGGGVISSDEEPTIRIGFPIGGSAVGATRAIEAGEREAWKRDNRAKLGVAPMAERHLVVYIDASNDLPWTGLTSFAPPSTLPKLPPEITNLWLIGHGEKPNEFVAWYAGSHETWHAARVVSVPGA
jgi:hypothetical protein